MAKKMRIVKEGDKFYPYERFLFLWFNFVDEEGICESFDTLEKAIDFCQDQKKDKKDKIVWRSDEIKADDLVSRLLRGGD